MIKLQIVGGIIQNIIYDSQLLSYKTWMWRFENLKKLKVTAFILGYCSNDEQIYYNGFRFNNRHAMILTILRSLHW